MRRWHRRARAPRWSERSGSANLFLNYAITGCCDLVRNGVFHKLEARKKPAVRDASSSMLQYAALLRRSSMVSKNALLGKIKTIGRARQALLRNFGSAEKYGINR